MGGLLCTVLLASTTPYAVAEESQAGVLFDVGEIVSKEYPSWFKPSFMDLRDDLADARGGGKAGLMLFFDSDGCAYCKVFMKHTLGDPGIQTDVRATFDVIGLDMFGDIEITVFSDHALPLKDFAIWEGATVSPTLVFYGTDGARLLQIRGYYPVERFRVVLDYLAGGHYATETLRAYAATRAAQRPHQPAAPPTDTLFGDGPYVFDRSRMPAQRPLLVLFEGDDCAECRTGTGSPFS